MRSLALAIVIAASAAQAQATVYDAEQLSYDGAKAYDAGDSVRAALLWRLAGKAGSTDSMTAYAGLLAEGDGVRQDHAAAIRWYARAARRGDAHAMVVLAEDYYSHDPKRATRLLTEAAALGHEFAKRRLALPPGEIVVTGEGGSGILK